MSSRERFVLASYFLLLLAFVGGFVAPAFLALSGPAFAVWMGLVLVAMGGHLILFRRDHSGTWVKWGGPSEGAFLMVGLFLLGIGVFFLVNVF